MVETTVFGRTLEIAPHYKENSFQKVRLIITSLVGK